MRQMRYLNAILTVNAVLLAALLWTQVATTPVLAQPAVAQSRTRPTGRIPLLPNAAKQRDAQTGLLREIKESVDATRHLLERGGFKVEVTNLDAVTSSQADKYLESGGWKR